MLLCSKYSALHFFIVHLSPSTLFSHRDSFSHCSNLPYLHRFSKVNYLSEGEDGSMEYVPMIDMSRSNFLGIQIFICHLFDLTSYAVKLKSTRTKGDTLRKRGTDKKPKEEGKDASDIPTLAVPAGGTLSASSNNPSPTTPSNPAATTPPPSSAGPPVNAAGSISAPASASTPTKGKSSIAAKSPKKSIFPKIDGSDASAGAAQPYVGPPGAADESTLVTTSPILPSTKKKTHKKSGNLLEPLTWNVSLESSY